MNGTMLNASMRDTTVKENSGVLDMNNMAFYYHALPPVDDTPKLGKWCKHRKKHTRLERIKH